jgi:hypothetical protein
MKKQQRREFITLLSASALAGVAGAAALSPTQTQAAEEKKQEFVPGSKDKIEILPRAQNDKGGCTDFVVHLQGTFKERADTLGVFASWLQKNEAKFGSLCIVDQGPHRAVFRVGPASEAGREDADKCRPCHMPGCTCDCFQIGGPAGNCATCAHSHPDHH